MNYNESNAHSRDALIKFDEASHTYTFDGREFETVTSLVEKCFEQFDADYWAERKATPQKSAEDLKAEWAEKGRIARDLGTALHDNIERHYLGLSPTPAADADARAFANFIKFTEKHHLKPFRSEWRIFSERHRLAGTLDFMAENPDGTYEIWDWKRSNKVVDRSGTPVRDNRYGKTAFAPISHVPDTTFHHYALQVSIYRYILETCYGLQTTGGHLGVFHPDYDFPAVVDLPYLRGEVETLLNSRL